jgi:negative regulator of sigma E activity
MRPPDGELEEYLRGGSPLSLQYQREGGATPAHALDRRVLALSRVLPTEAPRRESSTEAPARESLRSARARAPCLAPLAFAACVLLSVAMVTALLFGPESARRREEPPRLVRTAMRVDAPFKLYSSDPRHLRQPQAWLRDIDALRRAGRDEEADAEYRRFVAAYPAWRLRAAR